MNLFNNIAGNDFETLLVDIGKDVLINGVPARAIVNNKQVSTSNDFEDDKVILTDTSVKRGDIINYNSNNYIVWSQINDLRFGAYYKCQIRKCNYKLNIAIAKDNQQQVQSQDAFISSKLFDDTVGQVIPLSQDQKIIYLTADNFNKQLQKQDRIIAYGRAWSIKGIDNTLETILMLLVEETTITDLDNIMKEIPNYFSYHVKVTDITIGNVAPIQIYEGKTIQIDAVTVPTGGSLVYSSSDSSIASIDNTGLITGIKEGIAIITVKNEDTGIFKTIDVEVLEKIVYINVEISNATPISIDKGATVQLNIVTTPVGGIVTYSSSDSAIATVNNSGLITGVSSGTVKITATIQDTNISTSIEVTVNESLVPAIKLTGDKTTMGIYQKLTITATTTPQNEPVAYAFVGSNAGCTFTATNNICVVTSASGIGIVKVRGTLINYPTVYVDFRFVVQ